MHVKLLELFKQLANDLLLTSDGKVKAEMHFYTQLLTMIMPNLIFLAQ